MARVTEFKLPAGVLTRGLLPQQVIDLCSAWMAEQQVVTLDPEVVGYCPHAHVLYVRPYYPDLFDLQSTLTTATVAALRLAWCKYLCSPAAVAWAQAARADETYPRYKLTTTEGT